MALYRGMSSNHSETRLSDDTVSSYSTRAQEGPGNISTPSLPQPRGSSGVSSHCTPRSLQYTQHDIDGADSSDDVATLPQLSKSKFNQPGLTCDTVCRTNRSTEPHG